MTRVCEQEIQDEVSDFASTTWGSQLHCGNDDDSAVLPDWDASYIPIVEPMPAIQPSERGLTHALKREVRKVTAQTPVITVAKRRRLTP